MGDTKSSDIMCFSREDILTKDSLLRPISMEDVDSSLWSDKCDYWDMKQCSNLNPENYNFIVLQLNIRSLLSNITNLKLLLTTLEQKNSPVDVLLLCETFLHKKTERLPHYKVYSNYRINHKGGGTSVLIRDGIAHR